MNAVRRDGLSFSKQLSEAFDCAFHDKHTLSTTVIFDNVDTPEEILAWEEFNGTAMIMLRWGLAYQGYYHKETLVYAKEGFVDVKMNMLYKAYMINKELPLSLLMVRVSETEVLIYGKDVITQQCAYGIVDLESKTTTTGTGKYNVKKVLGDAYADLLFNYLTMSF